MMTETDNLTFPKAEAKPLPTLVCVGNVGEVKDAYISSKSGTDYVVVPIVMEPLDGGKGINTYFTHRPEWLTRGFKPHLLKRDSSSAYFVYQKNIAAEDEYSLLRGLAGNEEAFKNLQNVLLNLSVDQNGVPTLEGTTEALRQFFANNIDATGQLRKVGYELRQQRSNTGDVDPETGKKIYVLERRYRLHSFWDVNDKGIKRMVNRANASGGNTIMTYSGSPF